MKKLNRKTLVADFIEVAFCLIIALTLLMMYAGCSEEAAPSRQFAQDGGYTEEQASLENLSVKGIATVRARLEPLDTASPTIGLSLSGMHKGSIVTLYELDADSLERTGVSFADTIENDGGLFDIQGVTLTSPYVWITAVERKGLAMNVEYGPDEGDDSLSVDAFVDIRDTAPVAVDVFSDLIADRVRVLMLIGNSFEDAMEQAKREILEALGIYGVAFDSLDKSGLDYYAMQSVFVRVMYSSYSYGNFMVSAPISKSFEQTGSFMRERNTVKNGVISVASDLKFKLGIPQGVYDGMGPQVAKEYQAMLLYEKYLAGMMSVMLDAGRCTSELEGTSLDAFDGVYGYSGMKFNLVCRSENWHLAYEQVPHTFGTMTDARDGNVYKTVTIDLGNKTQTWMAENLKYNGVKTSCLDSNERNCDIYGRQYDWHVAMGLGNSVLTPEFESMQECLDSLSLRYSTTPILYDSAYIEKCIAELLEPDSIDIEKCMYYGGGIPFNYDSLRAVYDLEMQERCEEYMGVSSDIIEAGKINLDSLALTQGVCPDGWRIPNYDDWETLFAFINRKWNSYAVGAFMLTAPSIGDPMGFNLYNTVAMEWDGDRSLKIERLLGSYIMISKNDDPHRASAGYIKMREVINASYTFYYDSVDLDPYINNLFVRCIKD